jgi:transposase
MGSAVRIRTDYSAEELRRLAKASKNVGQIRRLLSLAAVLEGMSREDAARVGGMDRQTLRDWVHRFNAAGPDGLKDAWRSGPEPRLSAAQRAELSEIVRNGPGSTGDGVARWRRADLRKLIMDHFGVDYHERYVGKLLKKLGLSRNERPADAA